MFNKKITLILMTLVFMLSVSAVVAADANSTDDVIASEVDEEPPSGVSQDISTDEVLTTQTDDNNGSAVSIIESSQELLSSGDNNSVKPLSSDDDVLVASNAPQLIKANDVTKTYKSTTKYAAKFSKADGSALAKTKVKFILSGKTYTVKTNAKGVAKLPLDLKVGTYTVCAVHPNGHNITNTITVTHSVVANDLEKHYLSSKHFTATFYGTDGKVLKNTNVKFYANGNYFVKKTNSKGKATLKIISIPRTFKVISINTKTGEQVTSTVKVLPTLYAKSMTVFTGTTSKFKVKLYKGETLAKNAKMTVYVDGSKKVVKTNAKGIAKVKFRLDKGTYNFRAVDPYTGYNLNTKVVVKLASIKAYDIGAIANEESSYQVTLLNQNGNVAANTKMQITINGTVHTVTTNSNGVASVKFNFPVGQYKVVSKDLSTGYQVTTKITVMNTRGVSYDKYGVSADGKTILAIGRPSAPGEESKYGWAWYMAEFERTCPYCHGHNLYWDVFWAGDETTEVGIFPATGNREPGSTEGMIFCADCDCDFSVFGNEHVYSNPMHLTIVSGPTPSSKEIAYILKSGKYVKI